MANTIYVSPVLPWDPLPGENKRLRILMIIMLILALLIILIVPQIKVPEVKRAEAEAVPERLAKLVVQQKIVPPVSKPIKKEAKAEKEHVAKPTESSAHKKTGMVKPAPVEPVEPATTAPKAVVTDLQKSAAKARASKAMQDAGITDALADLRDMNITAATPHATGHSAQTAIGGNELITNTTEAGTSRNLLTSRAGVSSGTSGAYVGNVSSGFGGGKAGGKGNAAMLAANGGHRLQTVQSNIGTKAPHDTGKDGKSHRTSEDIRKVFDANGSRLNNLYQRALRDDPTMQGTIRLKLTVAPDGSVTNVTIVSDQLNNPELEAKVLAIVKGFNFGAANVEIWSGSHDLNFFPG